MENRIERLKEFWRLEKIAISKPATEDELLLFQNKNGVFLPNDLLEYFKTLNGSNDEYDVNFFKFYSLSNIRSINDELKNWNGVPDYRNITNTLFGYKSYFVFADFSFNMFSYVIKLCDDSSVDNQVLVVSGDEYKVIANSFSDFIDLYLDNSIELQLSEDS